MRDVDDPDLAVRRVRRHAVAVLVVLAIGVALVTRSPIQVLGVIASGSLMLLNFQGLVSLASSLVAGSARTPSALQLALLAGRYVLLGIGLCVIVLLPGVGPIPVALGLSVLVLAIFLEAIFQLITSAGRAS